MSFCIVVPTLNQGVYLPKTLDSLSRQGSSLAKIIIYDAGSSDDTPQIIQDFLAREPKAIAFTRSDNGQADAINKGLGQANTKYLGYLNSDDIIADGALERACWHFENRSDIDIVTGSRAYIGPSGRRMITLNPLPVSHLNKAWTTGFFQEATFWRASAYLRAGGHIDTSFKFAMDVDLWVRLRRNGSRVLCDPAIRGAFRLHGVSKSITKATTDARRELLRISNLNQFGFSDHAAYAAANWQSIRSETGLIRAYFLRKIIGIVHKPGIFRRF